MFLSFCKRTCIWMDIFSAVFFSDCPITQNTLLKLTKWAYFHYILIFISFRIYSLKKQQISPVICLSLSLSPYLSLQFSTWLIQFETVFLSLMKIDFHSNNSAQCNISFTVFQRRRHRFVLFIAFHIHLEFNFASSQRTVKINVEISYSSWTEKNKNKIKSKITMNEDA